MKVDVENASLKMARKPSAANPAERADTLDYEAAKRDAEVKISL